MISGMYLGELVRVVLVALTKEGVLFRGYLSEELEIPRQFPYQIHIRD